MSALDPVAVWVDLFDLTDHPPTDGELETFGQAIEQAVRAAVVADIRALEHTHEQVQEGVRAGHPVAYYTGHTAAIGRAVQVAKGKQT